MEVKPAPQLPKVCRVYSLKPDVSMYSWNVWDSTGAPGVRDIEASDLGKLSYMSAVIKEVLRVCAPAPLGGNRRVGEDTDICGYTVPKASGYSSVTTCAWFGAWPVVPDASLIATKHIGLL
eukprot:GHUV01046166.1.p1 GENE.GHUV01046166.1~~GHUV01046166.1.p1  ORF type:complete len:121 (-),score=11.14 GHUV01046166.1:202-564(-)